MRRRVFLGIAGGLTGALAGCTAHALPNPDFPGEPTPDTGCPAVLDVERRICPDEDGPVTVDRSGETVSGDAWSLVVTVTNRSGGTLGFNPHAWSVLRRADSGWTQVAPEAHIEPWVELAAGERYAWQLTASDDGLDDADQRVFLALVPGTYAFAVPLVAGERVGAVAPFEVTD